MQYETRCFSNTFQKKVFEHALIVLRIGSTTRFVHIFKEVRTSHQEGKKKSIFFTVRLFAFERNDKLENSDEKRQTIN